MSRYLMWFGPTQGILLCLSGFFTSQKVRLPQSCRASAGLSLALVPPVLLGFLSCRAKIQGILSCFTHSSILALVEPAPWLDEAVCYKYAGAIRLGDYAGVAWNSFPQIMSHLASSI